LDIDTKLDILDPKNGSPMRDRNPALVNKLLTQYKPSKGEDQIYSMLNWKGPTVKKLEGRRNSSQGDVDTGS
jgi:hypothetical protein